MDQITIRHRLQGLRERRNISQAELSQALGFNDRQTLSDIELGKRAVAPAELARAAGFLGVGVDYFTDPLELAGEASFSWRRRTDDGNGLEEFEQQAGRWIATYRHLGRLKGERVNSSMTRVALTARSSFEEAAAEGEAIARAWELGEVPALTLASVLEDRLDTLVLFVDAVDGVSGAACQLGPLNTILINRREPEGRRAFDLGHELFHLLTWAEMPPRHVETADNLPARYRRIEQLADNFSAGLLMPRHVMAGQFERYPLPADAEGMPAWICAAAARLKVSGQAMKWRLVALGHLSAAAARRLDDARLRTDVVFECPASPARFSRKFVALLGWGIEEGHVSIRKAAEVIGTTVDDLAMLFSEHGLKTPFDL